MNRASLYQRANHAQRQDAQQILQEYAKFLQWRSEGGDNLLDIGTGSGNVLMDFIYPLMPPNFERLVGSDISRSMIDYAQRTYNAYERVQFQLLDIGTEKLSTDLYEQFDHITSFYCLHWVHNQHQALRNIYQLLRPRGGDCLLVFLASHVLYDVYSIMASMQKWQQYMLDLDQFITPLHFSSDQFVELRQMLRQTGFSSYNVEIRSKTYVYKGVNNFKDNVSPICPYLDRIPTSQHEDFWTDLFDVIDSMGMREHDEHTDDYNFIMPYKLAIAYARKSAY